MRINARLLGLTLAAMAALTVPAFASAGIARLYAPEGIGTPESTEVAPAKAAYEFTGEVVTISPDSWTVGDQTFAITSETKIEDGLVLGDMAEVKALVNPDGTFTALEIEGEDAGTAEDLHEGEEKDGQDDDLSDDDAQGGEHQELEHQGEGGPEGQHQERHNGGSEDGQHEDSGSSQVDD